MSLRFTALVAGLVTAAPVHAQFTAIPGLFATGVDASGNRLAAGSADPHYTIIGGGAGVVINNLDGSNPCRMAPTWVAPPGQSCWIWQQADGQPTNVTRTFRTTFDLTGFDVSTVSLSGQWSADNTGVDILINGISTGQSIPNFLQMYNFSVNSGFVAGVNTLDFVIQDVGAVSGFLVGSLSGQARLLNTSVVPEPGTYALMMAGLAGLGVAARRRRNS